MFFFNRNQINNAVEEWRNMADAVLADVREADEFKAGHIPGAINVPLSEIHTICIPKDKQVFVYCLRGTRSRQAVGKMKKMGYLGFDPEAGTAVVILSNLSPNDRIPATVLGIKLLQELKQ